MTVTFLQADYWTRDRIVSIAGVAIVHALLGWMLLAGLAPTVTRTIEQSLTLFSVTPPPPPRPEVKSAPRHKAAPREEGRAAPPNIRSRATEVAAPVPIVVPPPLPPVVVVTPKPFEGWQATQGATPVRGPGTGAGGEGDGTGSGSAGDGDGGGGGGRPLRLIRDTISNDDYPAAAYRAGASGTVGLRFIVGVKGRVTDCFVTRTSGNADLDAGTCRLIKEKLRYRPETNAAGRPIAAEVIGEHRWTLRDRPDRDYDDE